MKFIPEASQAWRFASMWFYAFIVALNGSLAAFLTAWAGKPDAEKLPWLQDPHTIINYLLVPSLLTTALSLLGMLARVLKQSLPDVDGGTP